MTTQLTIPYKIIPQFNSSELLESKANTNDKSILKKIKGKIGPEAFLVFGLFFDLYFSYFRNNDFSFFIWPTINFVVFVLLFRLAYNHGYHSWKRFFLAVFLFFFSLLILNSVIILPVIFLSLMVYLLMRGLKIVYTGRELNYNSHSRLPNVRESLYPIWGIAGNNISGSASSFGITSALAGQKGEMIVGGELEKICRKYPQVRVIHGLRFNPLARNGSRADIDHLVIIGNLVFLIDAKLWQRGYYSWSSQYFDSEVLRNGASFPGGIVHMNNALSFWRTYLSKYAVYSYIVPVYGDRVDNSYSSGTIIELLPNLISVLEKTAALPENQFLDRRLLRDCLIAQLS